MNLLSRYACPFAFVLVTLLPASAAGPAEETRDPCTEDAMIVFDASGSMAGNTVQGLFSDVTRIDEVRKALAGTLDVEREMGAGDRFYVRYRQPFTVDGTPIGTAQLIWLELRTTAKGTVALHRFRPNGGTEQLSYVLRGSPGKSSQFGDQDEYRVELKGSNYTARIGNGGKQTLKLVALPAPLQLDPPETLVLERQRQHELKRLARPALH